MANPKGDIGAILQQTALTPEPPEPDTTEPEPEPKSERPPSREGKKGFTVYFGEDAHRQLKMMSVEQGTSMHELMVNALNILFELNNKPPIA